MPTLATALLLCTLVAARAIRDSEEHLLLDVEEAGGNRSGYNCDNVTHDLQSHFQEWKGWRVPENAHYHARVFQTDASGGADPTWQWKLTGASFDTDEPGYTHCPLKPPLEMSDKFTVNRHYYFHGVGKANVVMKPLKPPVVDSRATGQHVTSIKYTIEKYSPISWMDWATSGPTWARHKDDFWTKVTTSDCREYVIQGDKEGKTWTIYHPNEHGSIELSGKFEFGKISVQGKDLFGHRFVANRELLLYKTFGRRGLIAKIYKSEYQGNTAPEEEVSRFEVWGYEAARMEQPLWLAYTIGLREDQLSDTTRCLWPKLCSWSSQW